MVFPDQESRLAGRGTGLHLVLDMERNLSFRAVGAFRVYKAVGAFRAVGAFKTIASFRAVGAFRLLEH